MKKIYSSLALLCISFSGFSQAAEFTLNFEGTNPLSSLPAGVISVNPTLQTGTYDSGTNPPGYCTVYIAKDVYRFTTLGGPITQETATNGVLSIRAQVDNTIVTDGVTSSNVLQSDYTGHLIINEAAFGTGDFTIRWDYKIFGHNMSTTDSGFITIVGKDTETTWKSDRMVVRNGGYVAGMGFAVTAFPHNITTTAPIFNNVVLTYKAADQLYRLYKNGVLIATSTAAQASGSWGSRKIYLGFTGQNSPVTTGTLLLDSSTGEFTANAVRSDGRNADLQTQIDNLQVYKRAISDADVLSLYNTGTLAVNTQNKTTFTSYPNPVTDRLYFSTDDVSSVTIYNVLGAKVKSLPVSNNSVDMSGITTGNYIVKCKNTNGVEISTIKVIKK